jgi:hypothetical protein
MCSPEVCVVGLEAVFHADSNGAFAEVIVFGVTVKTWTFGIRADQ